MTADGAHDDLDELVQEAYDATATWQAAKPPMLQARAKLQEAMKAKGITDYTADTGIRATIKSASERLLLKKTDDVIELDDDED